VDDLANYLLDTYGECSMGLECSCIQPIKKTSPVEFPTWLGRYCPNWKPLGATTHEELLDWFKKNSR
jgi:hypothetical protein